MNGQNKEETPNLCKKHVCKPDKELYRVCPSKLSKRELEDLYFTLLENNLELKKTNNIQQDKIKLLSTKVQRMTATQKSTVAKEPKDCCAHTKSLLNEQKGSIAELRTANERMAERIRVLNMRLCSAKQFLRRSPSASTSRCIKCCAPNAKNSTLSVINTKRSDTALKTSVSSQCLDKDAPIQNVALNIFDETYKWFSGLVEFIAPAKTVATTTNDSEKESPKRLCDENRCQTLIEELKQKVVDLQEELFRTHEDYTTRITGLEEELSQLQNQNRCLRTDYETIEYELQQQQQLAKDLAKKLRGAEARQAELETQLTIEKQKVLEMEANARAADISRNISATIERHLSNRSQMKNEDQNPQMEKTSSPYFTPRRESSPSRLEVPCKYHICDESMDKSEQKMSDDSGYTDANKSQDEEKDKELNQLNKELLERINELQQQMEDLKVSTNNAGFVEAPEPEKQNEHTIEDNITLSTPRVKPAFGKSRIQNRRTLEASLRDQEISNDEMKYFAQTKAYQDVDSNLGDETPRKNLSQKSDTHNSLQIPGPLPVNTITKGPKLSEKAMAPKIKETSENKRRISITKNIYSDVSTSQGEKHLKISTDSTSSLKLENQQHKSGVNNVPTRALSASSAAEAERRATDDKLSLSKKGGDNVDGLYLDQAETTKVQMNDAAVETDDFSKKSPEFVFCERHARVCSCRPVSRRDVAVFRTCSGTLRFKTTNTPGTKLKQCECIGKQGGNLKCASGVQTDSGGGNSREERSAGSSKGRAAFVPAPAFAPSQRSRATSPDNTDIEISSLTDLPSEKESKSPRAPLSPGEDKATTTYTDSYTQPTTDYGSLSEGELPSPVKGKRLSTGEAKVNFANDDPISHRMEEALHAVSMELARCRDLLRSHRPPERRQSSRDVSITTEENQGAPLKRKPATPSIGDTFTPKCIFTLHIGTVVLSDEAVINSRDMSLMLMWKFFDHDVAMTRMRAGRVILFDFSTEYDVKITTEFLNYLKYEEMPLFICELDQQNESFAICSLPLRDALIHTNRRADMSLALMAGPKLRRARAARDSLDSSDEVGVIDLWCTLRVDPGLLPSVNQAIAKTSTPPSTANTSENRPESSQHVMNQIVDEDNPADYWLSHGQGFSAATSKKPKKTSLYNVDKLSRPPSQTKNNFNSQSMYGLLKKENEREPYGLQIKDQTSQVCSRNKDPEHSSQDSFMIKEPELKQSSQHTQSTMHTVIMNEVPAKIKSIGDVKQALERNLNQAEMPSSSKIHRSAESKKNANKREKEHFWSKNNELSPHTLQSAARSPRPSVQVEDPPELTKSLTGNYRMWNTSKKSIKSINDNQMHLSDDDHQRKVQVTILWLALNEECDAMVNPSIQWLYVAYEFIGYSGAELETPVSLPKPKGYAEKCSFNFSKTFHLNDCDLPLIGHMAKCRSAGKTSHNANDCIIFTVVSEPMEDPLGIDSCQDIGYAYLYLGDLLAYSGGNNSYTEVVPVRSARPSEPACGVLAVKLDGLDVVRRCLLLAMAEPIQKKS